MRGKYSFEGVIGAILLIVLFFVVLTQIFGRVGVIIGLTWTEELARWLWVWMAMIGMAAVERNQSQLRMGMLTSFLPQGVQRAMSFFFDAVYLALACHLVWIGYGSVVRTWNNEAVSLPVTDALLYASGLVAFVFIVGRIAQRLLAAWRNPEPGRGEVS